MIALLKLFSGVGSVGCLDGLTPLLPFLGFLGPDFRLVLFPGPGEGFLGFR